MWKKTEEFFLVLVLAAGSREIFALALSLLWDMHQDDGLREGVDPRARDIRYCDEQKMILYKIRLPHGK